MTRTSGQQRLRRTGRLRTRWHLLGRLPRIHPSWPWWAAWTGGATAVAAALDRIGVAPWWAGPPAGLVAGGVAVASTALDDVRRPVASLRVLAAEVRRPGPFAPGHADAVRAAVFDIPLHAPPGVDAWLSGGGASYGPGLWAATRRRLRVRWGRGNDEATATTVVGEPRDPFRWVVDGWGRTRAWDPDHRDHGDVPFDRDAVAAAVVPLLVVVDGVEHTADAVDLGQWGGGWAASLCLDDRHQVDLSGGGRMPDRVDLERRAPRSLVRDAHRP